jgi:hypothetical protein
VSKPSELSNSERRRKPDAPKLVSMQRATPKLESDAASEGGKAGRPLRFTLEFAHANGDGRFWGGGQLFEALASKEVRQTARTLTGHFWTATVARADRGGVLFAHPASPVAHDTVDARPKIERLLLIVGGERHQSPSVIEWRP